MEMQRQENEMNTEQQIQTAIDSLNEAMRLMKELGLITEGDEDEWATTKWPSILRRLRMDYV